MKITHITTVSCRDFIVNALKKDFVVREILALPSFYDDAAENSQLLILDEKNSNSSLSPETFLSDYKGIKICISSKTKKEIVGKHRYSVFDYIFTAPINNLILGKQLHTLITKTDFSQNSVCNDKSLGRNVIVNSKENAKNEPPKIYRLSDGKFLGISERIKKLHEEIFAATKNNRPVFLLGETGVGKSTAAELIYKLSSDYKKSFYKCDLAKESDSLFASQLFGVSSHAYTDAQEKKGILDICNGGTVFFDELGSANNQMQSMFLSAVEEGVKCRLGDTKREHFNIRMMFATNADIAKMIKEGLFRKDLYYRINYNTIRFPSLRERIEDIRCMVEDFCQKGKIEISDSAIQCLENHKWIGNLREFYDCLKKAKERCLNSRIFPDDIHFEEICNF